MKKEEESEGQLRSETSDNLRVEDLAEALELMKTDASKLLKDLLRGISMWGITALLAFCLAAVWLVLSEFIVRFAHPFGSPPLILDILYVSYAFSAGSALLGLVLLWRYYSLRKKYEKLFVISGTLH